MASHTHRIRGLLAEARLRGVLMSVRRSNQTGPQAAGARMALSALAAYLTAHPKMREWEGRAPKTT